MAIPQQAQTQSRRWRDGFVLDLSLLRQLDEEVRSLLEGTVRVTVSLEWSNASSLEVTSLQSLLEPRNAADSPLEVLSIIWRSTSGAISESCETVFSRRSTDAAMVLRLQAGSQAKLALLVERISSRLEGLARASSFVRRILTPPGSGEISPVGYVATLFMVAAAIWATRHFAALKASLATTAKSAISASESVRDVGTNLIDFTTATGAINNKTFIVEMLALATVVAVWFLESRMTHTKTLLANRRFLLGNELDRYQRGLALRDHLLWSGLIAFAVSAAASAVIWLLTR